MSAAPIAARSGTFRAAGAEIRSNSDLTGSSRVVVAIVR